MAEEPKPDPGNAQPSKWKGEPYNDADDLDAAVMGQFDEEDDEDV